MDAKEFVERITSMEVRFNLDATQMWNAACSRYTHRLNRESFSRMPLSQFINLYFAKPRPSEWEDILLDSILDSKSASNPPMADPKLPALIMKAVHSYGDARYPSGLDPSNIPKVFLLLKLMEQVALKGNNHLSEEGSSFFDNARHAVAELSRPLIPWKVSEFRQFPDVVRELAFYILQNIRENTGGYLRGLATTHMIKAIPYYKSISIRQRAFEEICNMGMGGIGPGFVFRYLMEGRRRLPSTAYLEAMFHVNGLDRLEILRAVGALIREMDRVSLPCAGYEMDRSGKIVPVFQPGDIRVQAFESLGMEGTPEALSEMTLAVLEFAPFFNSSNLSDVLPSLQEAFSDCFSRCSQMPARSLEEVFRQLEGYRVDLGRKLANALISSNPIDASEITSSELDDIGAYLSSVIAGSTHVMEKRPTGARSYLKIGSSLIRDLWQKSACVGSLNDRVEWVAKRLDNLEVREHPALAEARKLAGLPDGRAFTREIFRQGLLDAMLPPLEMEELARTNLPQTALTVGLQSLSASMLRRDPALKMLPDHSLSGRSHLRVIPGKMMEILKAGGGRR